MFRKLITLLAFVLTVCVTSSTLQAQSGDYASGLSNGRLTINGGEHDDTITIFPTLTWERSPWRPIIVPAVRVTITEIVWSMGRWVTLTRLSVITRTSLVTSVRVYAGDGHDRVRNQTNITSQMFGGDGWDQLCGDGGVDILYGENGFDTLAGGNGDDMLFGGPGYDLLQGGNGADRMYGHQDADMLIYDEDDIVDGYLASFRIRYYNDPVFT